MPMEAPKAGFNFENCKRNAFLSQVRSGPAKTRWCYLYIALFPQNGYKPPKMTKTGTTICAVVWKDGVVLGADTRSTGGDIVANKNCEKLHFM